MKQLPEKIALDKAVHGQRHYQGSVELKQLLRLTDMLAGTAGLVEFSIQFERAARILGKAQVKVKADLPLICTISTKKFMFPVEIDSTIGFIDDLAYEDLLELGMEASWVEEGMINPLEIIEDELILAVPDAPFDEAQSHVDETKTSEDEDLKAHKPNPFSVLENLK
jgi:uncharacterized protein